MQKNILITGASGFIGSFLVEEAIKRNYRTFAGIRNSSSKKYLSLPNVQFIELDFSNDTSLDSALINFTNLYGKLDFVIHNAGITRAKTNEIFDQINFENTKKFVQALQRNNQVPQKFIYISSLTSYGPAKDSNPINHQQPQKPLTGYGRSKMKSEEFLYATPFFPFLIINPTTVYGPRDKDVLFLVKSIVNHLEVYIGNKKQLLSFVHVLDLCRAVFIGMESSATNQNILVSDMSVYTAKRFNEILKLGLQKKTISLVFPVPLVQAISFITEGVGKLTGKVPILNKERLKEFVAPNWSVDASEIAALGYEPKYGLEDGLKNTIDWYKEQGWIKEK